MQNLLLIDSLYLAQSHIVIIYENVLVRTLIIYTKLLSVTFIKYYHYRDYNSDVFILL